MATITFPTTGPGVSAVFSQPDVKVRRNNFYYNELKALFDNELYTSYLSFSSWALALTNEHPEIFTEAQLCHVYLMCGDAAYRLLEFQRAEAYYRQCLQLYKPTIKLNPAVKSKLLDDCGTSTDLKYKVYLCLAQNKKTSEALKWLETIPAKQRTVQVNMAMGHLYKKKGVERAAITSFKEVLKVCPMALDALEQLLLLGCNEDDVQSLVRDKTSKSNTNLSWYNSWIRGTAAVAAKDNFGGIKIFTELKEQKKLSECSSLLHSLGMACINYGDYQLAIKSFGSALKFDPLNMKGMDTYSFALWHEEVNQELQRLQLRLNEHNLRETKSEPWVATAYFTLSMNRLNRAQIFSVRGATFLGITNPEGIICQGHVYLKMKKYQEAVMCFRDVMARCPGRFESYRGVVECYLATARIREAMNAALSALKEVGHSPRVYNLCATALSRDPLMVLKAKSYLDKALEADPNFVPAILTYADIYDADGKYNEGIQFLKNYIELRVSPSKLHVRLGAMLSKNGQEEAGADEYAIALRLDPSNKEARQALDRLDPTSAAGTTNAAGGGGGGVFDPPGEDMDLDEEEEDEEAEHADQELDTTIWEEYGLHEAR